MTPLLSLTGSSRAGLVGATVHDCDDRPVGTVGFFWSGHDGQAPVLLGIATGCAQAARYQLVTAAGAEADLARRRVRVPLPAELLGAEPAAPPADAGPASREPRLSPSAAVVGPSGQMLGEMAIFDLVRLSPGPVPRVPGGTITAGPGGFEPSSSDPSRPD